MSEIGSRPGSGRAVDDVREHGAALEMTEEVEAETAALTGAGDQAGHVATVKVVSPDCTTPRFGTRVVNG